LEEKDSAIVELLTRMDFSTKEKKDQLLNAELLQ